MADVSVNVKGLVTILAVALIFVLAAVPLVLRKVPRNSIYGFRTSRTLANDRIWYAANHYFGRALIGAALVSALAVLLLYFIVQPAPDVFFKTSLVILIVPSGAAILLTIIRIRDMDDR